MSARRQPDRRVGIRSYGFASIRHALNLLRYAPMTTRLAMAAVLVLALTACHQPPRVLDEAQVRRESAERLAEHFDQEGPRLQAALADVGAAIDAGEWDRARELMQPPSNQIRLLMESPIGRTPEVLALRDEMDRHLNAISNHQWKTRRAELPYHAPSGTLATTSPRSTCGPIDGQTAEDMSRVAAFCAALVPANLGVEGAYAMQSLLWVKVSRQTAEVMLADRLSAEQVVKNWMTGWRRLSGSQAVTVHVEWQNVEIAKGDTTLFSGDVVTMRR